MPSIARMLCVTATTVMAGVIAFGPIPQSHAQAVVTSTPQVFGGALHALPDGPLLAEVAVRRPAVSSVLRTTTGTAAIALTFDDGPDPRYTPRILALLRQYKVKATFCLIGSRVRAYPALVRAIVRDGHTLCNHTLNHDEHLKGKSDARIAADLAQTSALIRGASGVTPRYFRAPGGNWSTRVRTIAARQGMQPLHWAVDPQDWRRPPASRTVANVISHTRRGSVILLHDGGGDRSQTVAAVRSLLPYLQKRFTLVSL